MTNELHQLTKKVLERGYLMSLGIVDDEGPWVADVIWSAESKIALIGPIRPILL